tara:strand:+ start:1796 stop:3049 length:1254 start_codon:yes stop_codon:yes gene_type:complete
MDKLIVVGGNKLNGDVSISGSKNAVLPIMTATLIVSGNYKINNVPNLRDTQTMIKLLKIIGAKVEYTDRTLTIDTRECDNPSAPYELVKTMRASFYVLGPLLSRFHYSKVSLPGGCAWGPRPVDFHIKALREMNVKVNLDKGDIVAEGQPLGGDIIFKKKSVGATGNVLMASVKAIGKTNIINAAKEPEIVALGNFLIQLGADIRGLGTDNIKVTPIKNENNNIEFDVIPDRIEAGTFMIAAAAIGGDINIKNADPMHLESVIGLLQKINIDISINENNLFIKSNGEYNSIDMETSEYPGFPTDLQAQWMAMMIKAKGSSIIKENIYSDRFTHIAELSRMGANIELKNEIAYIKGVDKVYSAPVMCTDIRASAALVISALASKGESEISRIYHIDRGYENIEEKFSGLGGNIKRITS